MKRTRTTRWKGERATLTPSHTRCSSKKITRLSINSLVGPPTQKNR